MGNIYLTLLLSVLAPITPVAEPTPQEYLILYGESQNLSNEQIEALERIIECESEWNPKAQNPKSSAAGLFQIVKGTWESNSEYAWSERYNYKANIETGIKLFKRRGTQPWVCK